MKDNERNKQKIGSKKNIRQEKKFATREIFKKSRTGGGDSSFFFEDTYSKGLYLDMDR